MMRNLKKNRKKGFTLVELIVVLVILAILAALLIPALTGYIDKAKDKQVVSETRQAVMAAQTMSDEEYAKGTSDNDIETKLNGTSNTDLKNLADVPGTISEIEITNGKVTSLKYTGANSKSCVYTVTSNKGEYSDPS